MKFTNSLLITEKLLNSILKIKINFNMQRYLNIFKQQNFNIIGMIHVGALPGTPNYKNNWHEILEKAKYEANTYAEYDLDSILIENMHDIPYVQQNKLGPETVACMTRIATEIRNKLPKLSCGIQVLAGGNKQALSIAKAANLQYIRAEGFIFAHIADEGYMDACAGEILRYRKQIDANDVLIFTDLKKKHSSHAITSDVNLLETAKAAEFFLTDGIIITGNSTGHAANANDFMELNGHIKTPLIVGSGVTTKNVEQYFSIADAAIIGSHFKINGYWENELCNKTIGKFMDKVKELRITNQKGKIQLNKK